LKSKIEQKSRDKRRALMGDVSWKAQEAATARKTYANKKAKSKAALDDHMGLPDSKLHLVFKL
jgi:hypothetical protein